MSNIFMNADHYSRRQFVAGISKSLLGVGLAPLVGARLTAAADKRPFPPAMATNAKSVIYLYMNGGMSHIDSFDVKPNAPEVQGATKAIPTNVDGIQVGHYIPKIAQHMDKSLIINSMSTTSGAHRQSQYLNHASYPMRGTITHPTLASWVSLLGGRTNPNLPASVVVGGASNRVHNGYLSAKHSPLPIQNPEAGLKDSAIPSGVDPAVYQERLQMAQKLNREFTSRYNHRDFKSYQELYDEALVVMKSADLEAFDLDNEDKSVRDAYGRNNFGQGCLLARRLVERKVRFVEVEMGGWDTHNDHFNRFGNQTRTMDTAIGALLSDLEMRGMLDETLVVLMTDFGRTPRINGVREGRDHHPGAFSTFMAGGGIKGGTVYGKTDEEAKKVIENKVTPQDFNATIGWALGLADRPGDSFTERASVYDRAQRPTAYAALRMMQRVSRWMGPVLVVGLSGGAMAAVDFEKEVLPILEDRCVECHRAPYEENGKIKKPKGDLRMDGRGWLEYGVEGSPIIMPGNPRTSLLLTVVSLPPDDDEIMPPKGDPLSRDQIDLLRRWIEEGASYGEWRGNEEGVPKKTAVGEGRKPTSLQTLFETLAEGVAEPSLTGLARARKVGAVVVQVYTNSPLVEVSFAASEDRVDDQAMGQLSDLSPQIARLDLSRTQVSDGGLFGVGKCKKLTRLSLRSTSVSGKGMADLKGLSELRFLNLSETQVGDDAVPHLSALKNLEKLYLWGSEVTADGVDRLKKALPNTQVVWQGAFDAK